MKTTTITKERERVAVVWFGLAGHTLEMERSSLHGYEDPETFQRRVDAGDYVNYSIDGALVLDKREALDAKPFLAFRSPLVSAKLTGDQVNACPMPDPLFASALTHDPGNAFAGLLALHVGHKITPASAEAGPLDSVSPVAYLAWWRHHGARTGRMVGNRIEWDQAPEAPAALSPESAAA